MRFGNINQRVQDEIEKMFPGINRKYVDWKRLKTLKHHILVVVSRHRGDSLVSDSRFLALDTLSVCLNLGSPLQQTSTEGLLELLRIEEIRIEEKNSSEIVELFGLLHPQKKVLESTIELEHSDVALNETRAKRVRAYLNTIRPPSFDAKDKMQVITFWTIDFWTGDLEQWDILEDVQGGIRVERKILESKLIPVLL